MMRIHNTFWEKVFEILESQLRENNPPETTIAFERLLIMGYEDHEAKNLMVKCLMIEITDALNNNKLFNENRYIKNLFQLPLDPEE
jgi:hypothetical protein